MSNIEKEENKTKTKQSYQEFKGGFHFVLVSSTDKVFC